MHAVSNLFNAVIIQLLGACISIEVMAVYSFLIIALGVIGLIFFLVNRKKLILDGTSGILDKQVVKDVFTNRGILLYTALTLVVIVLKGTVK